MELYESLFIIRPTLSDEETTTLIEKMKGTVTKNGATLVRAENWGRKKLAYEIGRYREGIYVLELIKGPGELVKELDRRLKVTDGLVRHLVVRVDEELEIAERRQAERKEERARRRAARGLPPEPEPSEMPATSEAAGDDQNDAQAEA